MRRRAITIIVILIIALLLALLFVLLESGPVKSFTTDLLLMNSFSLIPMNPVNPFL